MSFSPTNPSVENGRRFVETSQPWKDACSVLPSFAAVWWPDYATTVIEDTIDGKPVVIQLWKGWCQQFLQMVNFPGGVGAEVGIYRRMPGRELPQTAPNVPKPFLSWVGKAAAAAGGVWWPYPELQTRIEFDFINPVTQQVIFHAGPETTYWLNKWMDIEDYLDWKENQPGNWLHQAVPGSSWNCDLRYTINGKTYPVWKGHN